MVDAESETESEASDAETPSTELPPSLRHMLNVMYLLRHERLAWSNPYFVRKVAAVCSTVDSLNLFPSLVSQIISNYGTEFPHNLQALVVGCGVDDVSVDVYATTPLSQVYNIDRRYGRYDYVLADVGPGSMYRNVDDLCGTHWKGHPIMKIWRRNPR